MLSNFIEGIPNHHDPFQLFSTSHLIAILVVVLTTISIAYLLKKTALSKYKTAFRYSFFVIFLIEEVLFKLWKGFVLGTPISGNLSLNLCGITIILLMIVLLTKNERLYEITYFWGLAGATQAIITPDLGLYGFPHFRFFQFSLSHGSIIVVVIYFTLVEGLRPRKGSIKRVFLITNVYALIVFILNYFLGTNYLFISRKPEFSSAIDLLGPWPWYILSLEGLALIMFILVYIPFIIKDRKSNLSSNHSNTYGA